MFAAWKLSLKRRGYSVQSINHYLSAVRALFAFAEDADLIEHAPKLRRVRNDPKHSFTRGNKKLYTENQLGKLLTRADIQIKLMVLLGINCGFGPKDIHDVEWTDFCAGRATLPRSKTGVCQTFALWPETLQAIDDLGLHRNELIAQRAKRGWSRSDGGHVFITKYLATLEPGCGRRAIPQAVCEGGCALLRFLQAKALCLDSNLARSQSARAEAVHAAQPTPTASDLHAHAGCRGGRGRDESKGQAAWRSCYFRSGK